MWQAEFVVEVLEDMDPNEGFVEVRETETGDEERVGVGLEVGTVTNPADDEGGGDEWFDC
jgi:hypothetical protein